MRLTTARRPVHAVPMAALALLLLGGGAAPAGAHEEGQRPPAAGQDLPSPTGLRQERAAQGALPSLEHQERAAGGADVSGAGDDPGSLLRMSLDSLDRGDGDAIGRANEYLERAQARLMTPAAGAAEPEVPASGAAIREIEAAREALRRDSRAEARRRIEMAEAALSRLPPARAGAAATGAEPAGPSASGAGGTVLVVPPGSVVIQPDGGPSAAAPR